MKVSSYTQKNRTFQFENEKSCLVPGIGRLSNSLAGDLLDFTL